MKTYRSVELLSAQVAFEWASAFTTATVGVAVLCVAGYIAVMAWKEFKQ